MSEKTPSLPPLTEAESAEQLAASLQMRQDFTFAVKSFLDDIPKKDRGKIGILLSGGVDSTTLLWVLMEQGLRPHVYTYTTSSTEGISMDHKKAQILADHYNLPINVVNMPSDPDYIAQTIEKIFTENLDFLRKTRPDKEVPFLVHEMALAAAKDGVKYLFSGIGEGNIHRLSRSVEIRGRRGAVSNTEVAQAQVSYDVRQATGLAADLSRLGIRFCLPHFVSNQMGAFANLDWRQLNLPRKKESTLRAYTEEMEFSGINPQVSPMQSGDSGARAYFEEAITNSHHVQKFLGRRASSAIVFYNALENYHRGDAGLAVATQRDSAYEEKMSWAAHVNNGVALPEEFIDSLGEFIDLTSGKAKPPEEVYGDTIIYVDENGVEEPKDDDGDLFGLIGELDAQATEDEDDEEEVMLIRESDDSYSDKVDCYGYPLYIGSSQRGCPFAMAGLCSTYSKCNTEKKTNLKVCSSYRGSMEILAERLADISIFYAVPGGAYDKAISWIATEKMALDAEAEAVGKNL